MEHVSQKWTMFKDSTEMSESEKRRQLYQCYDEDFDDAFLKEKIKPVQKIVYPLKKDKLI